MIDWLDFVIDVSHDPIRSGALLSVNPEGETEWQTVKRLPVRGSFESSYLVRSQGACNAVPGNASSIYFTGNPSKFLQGHNVFGSDDVCSLAAGVVRQIFSVVGIQDDLAIARVRQGHFSIKRIDLTKSFAFRDRKEVQAVLDTMATQSRTRMGRAVSRGGTVYHGQRSRRWTLKFYSKGDELQGGKKHKLQPELQGRGIEQFADNLLRAELTLRSIELNELGICQGSQFSKEMCESLWQEYHGRMELSAQAKVTSDELLDLPRSTYHVYIMWTQGVDIRNAYSKSTFYRHRKALLPLGVDVSMPYQATAQVIPLYRTAEGKEVQAPDWAYESGLIYQENN